MTRKTRHTFSLTAKEVDQAVQQYVTEWNGQDLSCPETSKVTFASDGSATVEWDEE